MLLNDCNGIRTHSHLFRQQTLNHTAKLAIWSVWLNGGVFVDEISGYGFEYCCSPSNFRYRAYFEQEVP